MYNQLLAPPEEFQSALDLTVNVPEKNCSNDNGKTDIDIFYEYGCVFSDSGPH